MAVQTQQIQIGQNTLLKKFRTGWDKIQFGQDRVLKGSLLEAEEKVKNPIWPKLLSRWSPKGLDINPKGPDRPKYPPEKISNRMG